MLEDKARCQNCGHMGHAIRQCWKPKMGTQFAQNIEQPNSVSAKVPMQGEASTGRVVAALQQPEGTVTQNYKPAKVAGKECMAYVDFGSDCSLMTRDFATTIIETEIKEFGSTINSRIGGSNCVAPG